MMYGYLKTFRRVKRKPQPNGWILHIPSTYLGIAQAARNYAIDFATSYGPNSIEGTISHLPTVQQKHWKNGVFTFYQRVTFWRYRKKDIIIQKINHTYGMKHLLVKC